VKELNKLQTRIEKAETQSEEVITDPAQLDYETGKKHITAGQLVEAAAAFHNALIGFEQSNNEKGIANAVNQLGDICMARSNYAQALEHFQRAYEICDTMDDPFSLLALKKKMAQGHFQLKNYDIAAATYMDILDMYRNHNNPQGAVETLDKLAEVFMEKDEPDRAADAYRTAASIHENFNHKREAQTLRDKAEAITAAKA
jgi:tetratricopeptide (TPR) repeat protein